MEGEAFHETWERFKVLLTQCPHHRIPLELLIQFFYDGLTQSSQAMVDNAAGGAMGEKTPEETYELYEMLGANSQQKSVRGRTRGMYEVNANTELSMQVSEISKQMKAVVSMIGNMQKSQAAPKEVCSFCGNSGHYASVCPSIERCAGDEEQANAMNFYNQQQRNDPYSNTYNPGWRNHQNFSWNNDRNQNQASVSYPSPPPKKPSLEDTLQSFIQATQTKFEGVDSRINNVEASLKKIGTQVGQIAEAVSGHTQGKLPSQPEQAMAVTILSGTIIDNNVGNKSETVIDLTGTKKEKEQLKEDGQQKKAVFPIVDPPANYIPPPPYVPPVPFPGRLKQNGKLKMTVLDETIEFSVYNSLALPSDSSGCFQVDELDSLISMAFVNQETEDKFELILTEVDTEEDEEAAQLKVMLDCAKVPEQDDEPSEEDLPLTEQQEVDELDEVDESNPILDESEEINQFEHPEPIELDPPQVKEVEFNVVESTNLPNFFDDSMEVVEQPPTTEIPIQMLTTPLKEEFPNSSSLKDELTLQVGVSQHFFDQVVKSKLFESLSECNLKPSFKEQVFETPATVVQNFKSKRQRCNRWFNDFTNVVCHVEPGFKEKLDSSRFNLFSWRPKWRSQSTTGQHCQGSSVDTASES